jgi:ABC-type transport system substrate-binding protein
LQEAALVLSAGVAALFFTIARTQLRGHAWVPVMKRRLHLSASSPVKQYLRCIAAGSLVLALSAGHPAWAQNRGGILRLASPGSPANMSIHESSTIFTEMPMMGVFNNLIVFDQHKPQVSLETIVADLATSWAWNKDDTALTFQLRQDVRWHDGKPFTAADVKCTWDGPPAR